MSPNKCLESVPGIAMVIAKASRPWRGRPAGALRWSSTSMPSGATSRRWAGGAGRLPTHVVAALARACERHRERGRHRPKRHERYRRNWRRLVDGLCGRAGASGPCFPTTRRPRSSRRSTTRTIRATRSRRSTRPSNGADIVIFPGRLTATGTFRIGVMGDLVESDMDVILAAMDEALAEIGVDVGGSIGVDGELARREAGQGAAS